MEPRLSTSVLVTALIRLAESKGGFASVLAKGDGNEEEFERFLARRRKFDPDLWVLELDIASSQRFADEMNDFR